jgi:hypothetical protein
MNLKRRNCGYAMHDQDAGRFLLRQVKSENAASLVALAAELNAAQDAAQARRIRGRIDLCIREVNRTSV